MVFQDYALFPHLTVAAERRLRPSARERPRRVPELLAIVGLDGARSALPARALGRPAAARGAGPGARPAPELVLLDEPWSNVDPFLRETLRAEVAEIIRPLGVTVVLVTHDREEAFSLADRIALMRDGTGRARRDGGGALLRAGVALGRRVRRAGERAPGASSTDGSRPRSAPSRRTARAPAGRSRSSYAPSSSSSSRAPPAPARGRRPRVPRARRLLPRAPRRGRARLAPPVHRGRPARLARLDPRSRRARAGARLSAQLPSDLCKVCLTPRLR